VRLVVAACAYPARVHAFLDETKRDRYTVVVALIAPSEVDAARKAMRGLALQRRVHFHKESDGRRRQIVTAISALDVRVDVYTCGAGDDRTARAAILEVAVAELAAVGVTRLVLETDSSVLTHDRRVLSAAVRTAGASDRLRYVHLPAHQEPLLWIPDAVAWCWTKNRNWRSLVERLVVARIDL
jgi:hypothetical protein